MNRNYQFDPHYAYNPNRQASNLPIEEQLRAKFANRGLGAVSVNSARAPRTQQSSAQYRPTQQCPAQPGPRQARPTQQRPAQSRPQQARPQSRPAQQKPALPRDVVAAQTYVVPAARAMPQKKAPKAPLYEAKTRRIPLPVAALVSLIVCTLTVLSLVMGAAMVSRASDELSDLKHEAASLANTERELSQALDRKNDLRVIERIAVDELGMIGTDLITKKYISFSGIDVIEAYDDGEGESVGLSTLLSAIGIRVD